MRKLIEENNVTSKEYTIEEHPPKICAYYTESSDEKINSYVNSIKVEETEMYVDNYNNETSIVEYSTRTSKLISKNDNVVDLKAQAKSTNSEYFTFLNMEDK